MTPTLLSKSERGVSVRSVGAWRGSGFVTQPAVNETDFGVTPSVSQPPTVNSPTSSDGALLITCHPCMNSVRIHAAITRIWTAASAVFLDTLELASFCESTLAPDVDMFAAACVTPTTLVAKPAAYAGLLKSFLKFSFRFGSFDALSDHF